MDRHHQVIDSLGGGMCNTVLSDPLFNLDLLGSDRKKVKEEGGLNGLLSCIGGVGGVSITIWLLFFVFLEPYDPSNYAIIVLYPKRCEWGGG